MKIQKTIEYGLYLLAFLLPWQTRWIFYLGDNEYTTYSIYGIDLLLFLLLFLFAVSKFSIFNFQFSNKSKIINHKSRIGGIWYVIAGLELFVFLSIFGAPDKLLALYRYGVFLLGVGLFWLVAQASYDRLKLIYCFLGGVFLQACLGIWQFLSQSSFACKWLGLATHDPAQLGTSVVETLSGQRWLRAYGGVEHPNVLGGLLAIGIIMLIAYGKSINFQFSIFNFQLRKKLLDYIFGQHTVLSLQSFYCFILVILAMSLFFTFSRGAGAGLVVGLITMLGLAIWKRDLDMQKKLLKTILVGGFTVFILFNLFSDLALTRLSQETRLEVKSNTERIESMQAAWLIIKQHWFFGTGIGNYTVALREIAPGQPGYYYQPVHDVFLLIWSEVGIFGLISFVLVLIFNFQFSIFNVLNSRFGSLEIGNWKLKISQTESKGVNNNYLRAGIITAALAMFLVDHWFWSLHFGVLLFWFVLGLLNREEGKDGN